MISTAFKQIMGETPTEYRKSKLQSNDCTVS